MYLKINQNCINKIIFLDLKITLCLIKYNINLKGSLYEEKEKVDDKEKIHQNSKFNSIYDLS